MRVLGPVGRLVYALASGGTAAGSAGSLGGLLLVAYPVSDAVATVFDLRRAAAGWPQLVNLGSGLAAAAAIGLGVLRSDLAGAILAFGGWAVLSGVLMVVLAIRRQRMLRGQWLMIISGAGSAVVPGDQDGTPVARRMKASNARSGRTSCRKMMGRAPYPAA